MKTLNTTELNEVMSKGLKIIKRFSINHVKRDEDFNNLYDYLMNESMNYYYKLLNDDENEVNEKTILNCFWHSINVLKLRHGILNNTCKVDDSVNEFIKVYGENKSDLDTIAKDCEFRRKEYDCIIGIDDTLDEVIKFDRVAGSGVDNKEYTRIVKSKYKIDRYNNISFQSIANTYTNRSTRNEVEHGISYVSIDDSEVLKNTLYSGLTPYDELIKKEQSSNVKKALKPLFNDENYSKFKTIVMSEKTLTSTQRSIKSRFIAKYPYLKELEKSDIIYLLNTYETL